MPLISKLSENEKKQKWSMFYNFIMSNAPIIIPVKSKSILLFRCLNENVNIWTIHINRQHYNISFTSGVWKEIIHQPYTCIVKLYTCFTHIATLESIHREEFACVFPTCYIITLRVIDFSTLHINICSCNRMKI